MPKGTNIGASGWAISHDEEDFPGSFVARPDRWTMHNDPLEGMDEQKRCWKMKATCAFSPSSLGAGRCAVRKLAMLEMSKLAARTLCRWTSRCQMEMWRARDRGTWDGVVVSTRSNRKSNLPATIKAINSIPICKYRRISLQTMM